MVTAELDEDFSDRRATLTEIAEPRGSSPAQYEGETGPDYSQGPDFGDDSAGATTAGVPFDAGVPENRALRPFENLPDLPPDLGEAFENFKLAILRHKVSGWSEVSLADVLAALSALSEFARAPS